MPLEVVALWGLLAGGKGVAAAAGAGAGATKSVGLIAGGGSLLKTGGLAHLLHAKGTAAAAAAVDGTAGGCQLIATATQHGVSSGTPGLSNTAAAAATTGSSSSTATLTTNSATVAASKAHLATLVRRAGGAPRGPPHPPATGAPPHGVGGAPGSTRAPGSAGGGGPTGGPGHKPVSQPGVGYGGPQQGAPLKGGKSVTVTRDYAEPTGTGVVHHITRTTTESTDTFEPAAAATMLLLLLPGGLTGTRGDIKTEGSDSSLPGNEKRQRETPEVQQGLEHIHQQQQQIEQQEHQPPTIRIRRTVHLGTPLGRAEAYGAFL